MSNEAVEVEDISLTNPELQQPKKKAKKKSPPKAKPPPDTEESGRILEREWVKVREAREGALRVKIMTWNMLAQVLVRRDLFPSSDCLKAPQREHMLPREILTYAPDIACLQEVDRLEALLPSLHAAGYSHTYGSGHAKKHGCMILHREEKFTKVGERVVHFDEENVRFDTNGGIGEDVEAETRRLRGSSRKTKNIGLLVALKSKVDPKLNCIVVTCHLFWHPAVLYEKARQAGILLREAIRFRRENGEASWPIYIAGDFNSEPAGPTYSLMVGYTLSPSLSKEIQDSRMVHVSIDPSVASATPSSTPPTKEDDESSSLTSTSTPKPSGPNVEAEEDPDKVNKNVRRALPSDGLLTDEELYEMFKVGNIRSLYDEGSGNLGPNLGVPTFGERVEMEDGRTGKWEPKYTSFTHFWRLTLDYIFVLDGEGSNDDDRPVVTQLLKPHTEEIMEPGLPMKGICGSDHVALAVEIEL